MSEERINNIEGEIQRLKTIIELQKRELEEIKRNMAPPFIRAILDFIKDRKVVRLPEVRAAFPTCYGANLTRLYENLDRFQEFVLMRSTSRWCPAIVAYFGSTEVKSANLMAFDYFQRIPPARSVIKVADTGKKFREYVGKQGSLKGIMETYNLERDTAYEVWQEIIRIFEPRLKISQADKTFRRKY